MTDNDIDIDNSLELRPVQLVADIRATTTHVN